jgi:TATA-box binding protein (TBP) (component of TFIID and TFIIIB)
MASASVASSSPASFDKIDISTETIIGKTNCKINIVELFSFLPVVQYEVIPKKRGRRPKDEKKLEPQLLKDGDIITLKMGDNIRGVDLKKKKSNNNNYFRNSITIVMSCDNKLINFKISKNGKFQFTGCKNDSHSHRCLSNIMGYIQSSPKKIISLPLNTRLEVIYLTVMANINFSLGFCVNKENLDDYVNKNTDYYSLLETTFGYTGVNIKIPLPNLDKIPITKMTLISNDRNEWTREDLTYNDYVVLLDEKEKVKESGKNRYNTFLVFQSGNVILSSPHKECMRDTYFEFLRIINTCRNVIEEKIEQK